LGPPLVQEADTRLYRDFVVAMFTARQSSVVESLRRLVGSRRARRVADEVGLGPMATPSEIAFEGWLDVFDTLKSASALHMQGALTSAERRLKLQQRRLRTVHRTRAGRRSHQSGTTA